MSGKTMIGVLFGVLLAAPSLHASTDGSASEPSFMFLSGGVTPDGVRHVKQTARDFDLLLLLDLPPGSYNYRDVRVRVANDKDETLFDANAEGPLFYVRVPPGRYSVTAALGDRHLLESVKVAPHETSRLTFEFRKRAWLS